MGKFNMWGGVPRFLLGLLLKFLLSILRVAVYPAGLLYFGVYAVRKKVYNKFPSA